MLQSALRVVHTVVTPGRFVLPNPEHELTGVAVSSDDIMRQMKREDNVASLQLLLKQWPYRRDCSVRGQDWLTL